MTVKGLVHLKLHEDVGTLSLIHVDGFYVTFVTSHSRGPSHHLHLF